MLGFLPIGGAPIGSSGAEYSAGGGDLTPPTFTGALGEAHTATAVTVSWAGVVSADNVAVVRREYRISTDGAYTPATGPEEASQSHTFAGLNSNTAYQFDVRCVDSSGNVSSPLSIVVSTTAVDATAPTFVGVLAEQHTVSTITIDWSSVVSADNVAVARREYRIGGAGAYTAASSLEEVSKTHTFTGLAHSTAYPIHVRCVDTSGNFSLPLALTVSTSVPDAGGVNHIRYRLTDHKGAPRADLVNLAWALFAQLSPHLFSAPIAKGTIASLPGVADLDIQLDATLVPAGWYMLVMADVGNGATVATPVLVS